MNVSHLFKAGKLCAVRAINLTGISSKFAGSPKRLMEVNVWINTAGSKHGATLQEIFPSVVTNEIPPTTLDDCIHNIFLNETQRVERSAFVATIPLGRVWGSNGAVIAPDDSLLTDVSREFGEYGGITGKLHSINRRLRLGPCLYLKKRVAVVGTAGTSTYYHWLYDTFPRFYLLKKAGLLDQIDYFIFNFTGQRFQLECLAALGISQDRIISSNDNWKFHLQAEKLIVPSLPSSLGAIGSWVVQFLRETFLRKPNDQGRRLYISRHKAPSRKVVNERQLVQYLESKGFIEFFAEDHSIAETASYFASADYMIGVHGSGFANLAFASQGARVIDFVTTGHLDPYFWMISNATQSRYAYLFGKGMRPGENVDLAAAKVDHDVEIDMEQLDVLFNRMDKG